MASSSPGTRDAWFIIIIIIIICFVLIFPSRPWLVRGRPFVVGRFFLKSCDISFVKY